MRRKRALSILSILTLMCLLGGSLPASPSRAEEMSPGVTSNEPSSHSYSPVSSLQTGLSSLGALTYGPQARQLRMGLTQASSAQDGCYPTDLDCDLDVDEADLQRAAGHWNCAIGESCYEAAFDLDGSGTVDAFDLAWVANDYDIRPPEVTILSPAQGQVVAGNAVLVTGLVSDKHTVVGVTVNDVAAALDGDAFSVTVPVSSGNERLHVVAQDEVGQKGLASRVIGVDGDGPVVEIHAPAHRQAVYSLTPTVAIRYTDFYTDVDSASLVVQVVDEGGTPTDVTADLAVTGEGAWGTLSSPLAGDASYTLTVSVDDAYGNAGSGSAAFYVPPAPESIEVPEETEGAGWVSGVVYDSSTCDQHLTTCQGLPGVSVTLAYSGGVPISGTIVTGPDGFFAFPVGETGQYWLRAEKAGYTYGQRAAEVVRERSAATNAIYVTPIDPAVTYCDDSGCAHTSSDGVLQVEIPAGVIAPGEVVTTTATNYAHVEFLPSGGLPPGTWETYAFNLGGDSEVTFTLPITVRQLNYRGFSPGTEIPLGYWNQETLQWEHEGFGVVDPTGTWVVMNLTRFSNHDPNFPVVPDDLKPKVDDECDDDEDECEEGAGGCTISLKSGTLNEDYFLPEITVLGQQVAPRLLYDSNRASPGEVIDVKLAVDPGAGADPGDYIGFELYIEGEKTDSLFISSTLTAGEVGRYRYLWDGRDSQGRRLPSGVYDYAVKLSLPYTAEYCGTYSFGGPPDCVKLPTGVFVEATADQWVRGTVELDAQPDSALGAGWTLDSLQRLYEDEAGRIMIVDGEREDEFYFPQKDLLASGAGPAAARPAVAPVTRAAPQPVEPSPPMLEDPETAGQPPPEVSDLLQERDETVPPIEASEAITLTHEPTATARERPAREPRPSPLPPLIQALPPYAESSAAAGTLVCGTISTDTVWATAVGTYVVTCDVQVLPTVTLTVEPGVVVQFEHAGDDLIVSGTLQAAGTEVAPVVFQPLSGTVPGSWGRVAFLAGSAGTLDHTVLEYGGQQDGLLYLASDGVQVLNSVVQHSADMGIVVDGASPLISGTQILSNSAVYDGGGIYILSGSPTVQGNTIAGNSAQNWAGGGLYSESGSPTIRDNTFQDNSAASGGGAIYIWKGSGSIQDNTIVGNSGGDWAGGGINIESSNLAIQGNRFEDNSAWLGAGIYNWGDDSTIRDNVFVGNSATDDGGGIYNDWGALTIRENVFEGNSAWSGGGVSNWGGTVTIQDNVFDGNTTSDRGGGIYEGASEPNTILNNVFRGNSATEGGGIFVSGCTLAAVRNNTLQGNGAVDGGGIYLDSSDATIESNTLVGNAADSAGGGIYSAPETFTIWSNIVASNTAGTGGGIYAADPDATPLVDYNDVWNNAGGDYWGLTAGAHDISADPLLVNPGTGDLHLSAGSPCIDAGDPANYPETDLEGDPRPMGPGPDIGADEYRTLVVRKLSVPEEVAPGGTITYRAVITNLGTTTASQVAVTDSLPLETAFVSYQAPGLTCGHDGSPWGGNVSCTLDGGSLVPGQSTTLTVTAVATGSLPAPLWVTNLVAATGQVDGQTVSTHDEAQTWVTWCLVRLNDGAVGTDIQAAIDASTQPADVVKVSGGCVVHDLVLNKTLTLQGGWSQDLSVRDPAVYTTTLDARQMGRVLEVSGAVSPTIEGFVITGGLADRGGGIYVYLSGSPSIQNNLFLGNRASSTGGAIDNRSGSPTIQGNAFRDNTAGSGGICRTSGVGGGIYSSYGNPALQGNVFEGNAAGSGGGLYNDSGSYTIEDNSFLRNRSTSSGGAIYNEWGDSNIENNTFRDNVAWKSNGGGIYNYQGSPTIRNNILLGNSAKGNGGGIDNYYGGPIIESNTLVSNTAGAAGGGIYNEPDHATIRSNLIASNTAGTGGGIYDEGPGPGPAVDYNDVWNNGGGDYAGITAGPHDISADPLLVDPGAGDLHLSLGSPCIDAADPSNYPETDFEGDPRPMGLGPDIGADEAGTLTVRKVSLPTDVAPGGTITYRAVITNLGTTTASQVAVTDSLPVEAAFVSYQAPGLTCGHDGSPWGGLVSCTLDGGSLLPGESAVLTVTAVATGSLLAPLWISNLATASGQADGQVVAAQDEAQTWVTWCRVRLNGGPAGTDIQAAIDASTQPTDVVKVSGGCLVHDLALNKTLVLQGGWSQDFLLRDPALYTTTLDARQMGRVLQVNGGVTPTIEGFAITGGWADDGGGIHVDSAHPTIRNNVFYDNSAWTSGYGGGVYSLSGDLTIESNLFTGNSAGYQGGGLYTSGGDTTVEGNGFEGNSARFGGAISNYGSATIGGNTFGSNRADYGAGIYNGSAGILIRDNTFQDNTAISRGGGIYNWSSSTTIEGNTFQDNSVLWGGGGGVYNDASATIRDNTFVGNWAYGVGGGLYHDEGNPTVEGNTFAQNAAGSYGGGIYAYKHSPSIRNNILDRNSAGSGGGGIYTRYGSATILNNTLYGNTAKYGGGVYNADANPTIRNNAIVGNAATSGGGLYRTPPADYNNVWDNDGGDYQSAMPGLHDISADPQFVDAEGGDFHLSAGSPCIDAGDPASHPATDLEGDPRPAGFGPDMGADEYRGLALQKVSIPVEVAPGDTFSYRAVITNSGGVSVSQVVVTDVLPAEVAFVSYAAPGLTCTHDGSPWGGQLECALDGGDLPPGEGKALTLTVTATDPLTAPLQVSNLITAAGQVGGDGVVVSQRADTWLTWCRVRLNDGPLGTDLQAAIAASTQPSDVIKVSGRCAVHDLSLDRTLTLQGGWSQDMSLRDPVLYPSTLDAERLGRVLLVSGAVSPTVEGFVITGGRADNGGGIRVDSGDPTIQANVFYDNWSLVYGGGIYNTSGSPAILNNTFQGNLAQYSGGGIYNSSGSPIIEGNTFLSNLAQSGYYGGGGVCNITGSAAIWNNTFQGNSASDGGGIYSSSGMATIWNNTLLGNSARDEGGGIYLWSNASVRNNAIVGNSAASGGGLAAGWSADIDYNDVWNNAGGDYDGISAGAHDISADPLFVDAEAGDLHLSAGSPCIDAGDPDNYPESDFEGDPRPMGAAPDIGVDERLADVIYPSTATDHSRLRWDASTGTYTRSYPQGTEVRFNPDGSHDYTLDRDGTKTAYSYNPDGTVAAMAILPPGETAPRWTWTFNYQDGKLAGITDPAGRMTLFAIDEHNHLTALTGPDGTSTQYAYDGAGRLTHFTDENGAITTYGYDAHGRIASVTEPPRKVYDPDTGQVEIVQEVRTFSPSDTGYALINNSPTGDPDHPAPKVPVSGDLVDRVDYGRGSLSGHTNRWGNWLDETDGLGRTTTYQRDEANNLTRTDYPDGTCTAYTYDEGDPGSLGNLLSETRMEPSDCALTKELTGSLRGNLSGLLQGPLQTWTYTYEGRFSQIKTETDPLGHTTTYVYDYEAGLGQAGHVIRIEYPPVEDENGIVVSPTAAYTYSAWGLLETETDARGTVTRYVYTQGTPDEAYGQPGALFAEGVTPVPGLLTRVIRDEGGLEETTTYRNFDAAGNPTTVLGPGQVGSGGSAGCCGSGGGGGTQAEGTVTHYTYDAWGRVLTAQNALGVVSQYEYDGRGNLIRRTEDYTPDGVTGRNVVTEYTYNAHAQLLSERTAAGGLLVETVSLYDINRKLALERDGLGHGTVYRYDEADQLAATIDPAGHQTSYTYAPGGQVETETDPEGSITRYVYDEFGRLVQEIVDEGGLNLTSSYTYDLNGYRLTATEPAGTVTCYRYDSHRRLVTETRDCGGLDLTTGYAHDLNGNPVYVTDPRGVVTYHQYDALGRRTRTRRDEGGLSLETSYAYDAAGNLSRGTDERGVVTTYAYDDLNRLVQTCQDALGQNLCTTYTYDRLGNRQTVIDPNGVRTRTQQNAFGLPVRVTEDEGGLNAITTYGYDNALNQTRITDPNGNTTEYSYSPRGELESETYADGTTIGYTYDGRGQVTVRTDQDGSTATHTYDGAGRLMGTVLSPSTAVRASAGGSQTFGYDPAGRLTSAQQMMNGHQSLLTFGYNALGDVISTTQTLDSTGWQVGYDYDYAGGVVTTTYPSGVKHVQEQDALGRLDAVRHGDGSLVADYAYDDLAGYNTIGHANGLTTRTDYDALQRTTRVSTGDGIVTIADYRYGYDAASNRTYMQRWHQAGQPADVYEYDGLYQLTQVWYGADATTPGAITSYDRLQWYDLDSLGNRLEVQNDGVPQVYLPNDGQKLTDPMNRYQQVDVDPFSYDLRGNTLSDGGNTYGYDLLNRQVSASVPGGTAEYIYDALGRRLAKVVDGTTTTYVYDLQYQAIEERAGDGNLAARYTYGAGIDEPLTLERDGKTYTYHRDALGSITEITDGMGALVERYAYDVYGEPQFLDDAGNPLAASAIGNPYLFTARRYDPESGNYDYRTRIYSPWTGRFLQIDPLGYADGLNRYRYGLNRPPSVIDPMGTLAWVKDISCEGTIVPEGLHWKATAQFSFLLDDEQCTMSKQAGPIYGGLHIAPPNSLLAVGDWATQRKITKKCCLKPGKTSGKKGRRCRRPNRCRRRGTEAKLVWTYRIRLYTSIGFRQYGYQRLQRTCYIPIHLTCQCKRGK